MNTEVDKYLTDGCMRCPYGGTPQCKVLNWVNELKLLRTIVLETGLIEEIKWGVPVYTHNKKNVLTINALKESANVGFFKGVLLTDTHKILQQQGQLQADRIIKFKNLKNIEEIKDILKSYIFEAIKIEESGEKVIFNKSPEPLPDELIQAFTRDSTLEKAFYALTPGRQRGYVIYFSQPKQSQTRTARIEKCKNQILNGIGINDKYKTQ